MTASMASFLKLTLVGDGGVGSKNLIFFIFFTLEFIACDIYSNFIILFKLESCLILQYMYGDVS